MPRISITLSDQEIAQWKMSAGYQSLSSFIREAVNEYVKIKNPEKRASLLDLILDQRQSFQEIQSKLQKLEHIEGDLIDITAALAKLEIIDFDRKEDEWKLKRLEKESDMP